MIETKVRVLRADSGTAWVEPSEQSGCGTCQAKSACAVSGLGRFFSNRRQPVPVCAADARPGEQLTVAMREGDFLKAGLLAYLSPALLAVAGGATAAASGAGDAWAVLGSGLGLGLGLLIAARLGKPLALVTRPVGSQETISFHQGETP